MKTTAADVCRVCQFKSHWMKYWARRFNCPNCRQIWMMKIFNLALAAGMCEWRPGSLPLFLDRRQKPHIHTTKSDHFRSIQPPQKQSCIYTACYCRKRPKYWKYSKRLHVIYCVRIIPMSLSTVWRKRSWMNMQRIWFISLICIFLPGACLTHF